MNRICVVDEVAANKFEKRCEDLLADGYLMVASSCGFFESDAYASATFQAIFATPESVPSFWTIDGWAGSSSVSIDPQWTPGTEAMKP